MKKERYHLKHATMESFVLCPFLVVVKDDSKNSGVNVVTLSYVGVVSEDPPIVGLAIRPSRHTHGLLVKHGEFTLNLPAAGMLQAVDYCGSRSGKKFDKAAELGLKFEPSQQISTPSLADCPVNLECEIRGINCFGSSHEFVIADVVAFQRAAGFRIEDHRGIVTANYDYRGLGKPLGRAFKVWNLGRKGGGSDAV